MGIEQKMMRLVAGATAYKNMYSRYVLDASGSTVEIKTEYTALKALSIFKDDEYQKKKDLLQDEGYHFPFDEDTETVNGHEYVYNVGVRLTTSKGG